MTPLLNAQTIAQLAIFSYQPHATYIFFGSKGVGKFTTAMHLAKQLNCPGGGDGTCPVCRQIDAGSFPDLLIVRPAEGASRIGISQIQELQQQISYRNYQATGQRFVIIDEADSLTPEAQNCLLKTIEEPPAGTIVILIAHQLERLLETVRSRSEAIYFTPPTIGQLEQHLIKTSGVTPKDAAIITQAADGLVGRATTLATDPKMLSEYQTAQDLAADILSMSIFDRLVLSLRLAEQKDLCSKVIHALASQISAKLRSTEQPDVARRLADQLAVIEKYWRQSMANVAPRAALEGLMLGLS